MNSNENQVNPADQGGQPQNQQQDPLSTIIDHIMELEGRVTALEQNQTPQEPQQI